VPIPPNDYDLNDPILQNLNDAQFEAVTHDKGPLLILAGAGSGKTRVITRRIAWLVRYKSVFPSRILAVTFTNKAADEMRERVAALLGHEDAPRWMGTFHSICLQWLRRYAERLGYPKDFVIYDDRDSTSAVKSILKRFGLPKEGASSYTYFIDNVKNAGKSASDLLAATVRREYVEVYEAYQDDLKSNGAMDFADLLLLALELLQDHEDIRREIQSHFDYVLVDEFQDTNDVQYQLLQQLVQEHRNLCVVGDDDQSIYSWRGAQIENILEFTDNYPEAKVVTLGNNYRSTSKILEAASRVISYNDSRYEKALTAMRGPGHPVIVHATLNEKHEADWVVAKAIQCMEDGARWSDIAVFYRTNAQSRVFEDSFGAMGIPYRVVGGMRFYQRKEVKDVIAYLRLIVNPADSIALERIFNVPPRGIGPATIDKARAAMTGPEDSLLMALARVGDQAGGAVGKRISSFIAMLTDLAVKAKEMNAEQVLRETFDKTGLLEFFEKDETPEGRSRVENVQELLASARQFYETTGLDDVGAWLDKVALVQPLDEGGGNEAVSLMTVHAAKGLEFPCVFVCGLEHGLFPLSQRPSAATYAAPIGREALAEERRLMYVAMTRAMDKLHLCYAATRMRYGQTVAGRPSVFLTELPRSAIKLV